MLSMSIHTHTLTYMYMHTNSQVFLLEIQVREIRRKQAKRKAGNGEMQRREKGQWRSQEVWGIAVSCESLPRSSVLSR